MVALDHREIGVRGGLDVFKVFIKQCRAHVRRKAAAARVEYAGDVREHIDVVILCPAELALIKALKSLRPVGLEIAEPHVQHGRRRHRAVVVHSRGVIDLVLRNGLGKRLREAVRARRYGARLMEVPGEMVLVVEVVIDLE